MEQISMWPPLGEGEDAEELNMIYRENRQDKYRLLPEKRHC